MVVDRRIRIPVDAAANAPESSTCGLDMGVEHVDDPVSAADGAVALGAQVVHRSEHGYVVLDSPGGLTFCFVSHRPEVRSRPVTWPEVHSSLVAQACQRPGLWLTQTQSCHAAGAATP